MVFLPRTDFGAQEKGRTIVETEVLRAGLRLFGWRQVPVDPSCLGAKAAATRPAIEQILFEDTTDRGADELERALYLVRRRIEQRLLENTKFDLHFTLPSVELAFRNEAALLNRHTVLLGYFVPQLRI